MVVFMLIKGKRRGLSAEQKAELWKRWKAGQSLHEIGRALGKDHVVIGSSQISQTDTVTLSGAGTVAIALGNQQGTAPVTALVGTGH